MKTGYLPALAGVSLLLSYVSAAIISQNISNIAPRQMNTADWMAWWRRFNAMGVCGPNHKNRTCYMTYDEPLYEGHPQSFIDRPEHDLMPGLCCGINGQCGYGPVTCGKHCQPDFGDCSTMWDRYDVRCGSAADGKHCPRAQCCSSSGYCGAGPEFCSTPDNCQSEFGICDDIVIPQGLNMSSEARFHPSIVPYGRQIPSCTQPKSLAFVFGDGPGENTDRVLEILERFKAKGTFFVSGNAYGKGSLDRILSRNRQLIRMITDGHQVGSATWSHQDLDNMTSYRRHEEMWRTERAMANVINKWSTYMWPPAASCTAESGCLQDMAELGYHVIMPEVETRFGAYDRNLNSTIQLLDEAFAARGPDGSMILSQEEGFEWAPFIVAYAMQKAEELGWKSVTIGECLNDPAAIWYRKPRYLSFDVMAKESCVVVDKGFCGKLEVWHNRSGCHREADQCFRRAEGCPSTSKVCDEYKQLCTVIKQNCYSCFNKACASDGTTLDMGGQAP